MIQHTQRTSGKRSVLRKVAWPVLMCSMVCVLIARPAVAEPTDFTAAAGSGSTSTIPDQGVLPIPNAPLTGPSTGQTQTGTATVTGPYASQIMAQYSALEATGEQLKQANADLDEAKQTAQAAYQAWQAAVADATRLQEKADNAASEAYKDAAGLGPYAGYATDVHQLSMLAPGLDVQTGQNGSEVAARDAKQAKALAATDEEAYRSALDAEGRAETKQSDLQTSYDRQSTSLNTLRATNQAQVAAAEAAQASADQQLDQQFGAGNQVNGMVANPKALAALSWAYSQAVAKPPKMYKFGAEGPNFFDCSGLTWASYYHADNYSLPRIAAAQYHATSGSRVSTSQLLPGDLLFFSTTSRTDWTTISHVAIYYGNNLMIEAAHEGTPVRINQVWWSAFFGATRVFPAVAAPGATPTTGAPTQGPPTTPTTPTTSPSHSPTPSPTPTRPTHSPTHPPIPSKTPSSPPSTPPTTTPSSAPPPPSDDPSTPSGDDGSSSPSAPSTTSATPSVGDGSSSPSA